MTITLGQLLLYIGALMVLFLTPGPVWFAIIARTVSGGAQSSIALALRVSFGDMLWPIIVFFGLNLLISLYSNILLMVTYFASIILALMGLRILIKSNNRIEENHSLTSSGIMAGFFAGFTAIIVNPKASLFYLTLMPEFFVFSKIGLLDLTIISATSFSVPFIGNMFMILFLDRVRFFLSSQKALQFTNILSGFMLIIVAILILIY